jgi:hypothetical protein
MSKRWWQVARALHSMPFQVVVDRVRRALVAAITFGLRGGRRNQTFCKSHMYVARHEGNGN